MLMSFHLAFHPDLISQPFSRTARAPPAYTLPLSRSGMSRELKILLRSAPKAWDAFLSLASTSWWSDRS